MENKSTGRIVNNLDHDILYIAKKNYSISIEAGFTAAQVFEYGKDMVNNITKKLKEYFTKELFYLNEYKDASNFLAKAAGMKKDFDNLKKVTQKTNHIDMVNFMVYIPEGMNCTYLEQLDMLIPSGIYINTYLYKTIDLLNVKLGELINNNDSLGVDILETQAKNIILEKDKLIKEFASKSNSKHETEVPLERVIKRASDWEEVHKKLVIHNTNMDKIKNLEVQNKMKKTNELIEIYIKKKEKKEVDKKLLMSLSTIVFNTASLIEFYVSIVYDTIAFNNAVNDSIVKIVKAKKE